MSNSTRRGPRPLSDILGELFTVRGYSRLRARQELEDAWNKAVGEPACRQTRVDEVRRGILNVTVAHSTLLEELSAFRKSLILKALRSDAPATIIHDIRFRVGPVVPAAASGSATVPNPASGSEETRLSRTTARSRRTGQESRSKPRQAAGPDPDES
jgi:hypothetical protein